MRTLMIMYEEIIREGCSGRHYVVLNRDHGNMDEVVDIIKNKESSTDY